MEETVVEVALDQLRETGVVFHPGLVAAGVNVEVVATANGIRLRIASRHGIVDTYLVDERGERVRSGAQSNDIYAFDETALADASALRVVVAPGAPEAD
jgi:hypothetical protein